MFQAPGGAELEARRGGSQPCCLRLPLLNREQGSPLSPVLGSPGCPGASLWWWGAFGAVIFWVNRGRLLGSLQLEASLQGCKLEVEPSPVCTLVPRSSSSSHTSAPFGFVLGSNFSFFLSICKTLIPFNFLIPDEPKNNQPTTKPSFPLPSSPAQGRGAGCRVRVEGAGAPHCSLSDSCAHSCNAFQTK